MKMATLWRAGSASDAGLQRNINEDRVFVDDARGVFMVVDGLGGHAAGETAAETAVEVIGKELRAARLIDETVIRKAITSANNEIFRLAEANASWRGMACVLTMAVASGDQFLVGHVGDSRLYSFWNGKLQKMTLDHSPVGELEDGGQITEEEAMQHPRRNEVFRDVGSYLRTPDDPRFIETSHFAFRPDAALLLCSDGLTDLVNAAEITRIIERYDGDSQRIAHLLVEAANAAGGRDNISVVFVPGPEFLGAQSAALADGRNRHATTRMRTGSAKGNATGGFFRNLFVLAVGALLGLGGWLFYSQYWTKPAPPPVVLAPPPHIPREIPVEANNPAGIVKALQEALPGDTILVPAGDYIGPLVLKDRVNIVAQAPGRVVVRSAPPAANVVEASGVKDARVKGLHLLADEAHPIRTGFSIANSSIEVEDVEVSGATECGMRIKGDSHPLVMASNFHNNNGPGVIVQDQSSPRLMDNRITDNGRVPAAPHQGIEVGNEAQPALLHNEILHNGLPAVFPPALDEEIRLKNTVDPRPAAKHGPTNPRTPSAHEEKSTKPEVKPAVVSHPTKPLTEAQVGRVAPSGAVASHAAS
jgi:serine/threonine protein phosphatase PrpC